VVAVRAAQSNRGRFLDLGLVLDPQGELVAPPPSTSGFLLARRWPAARTWEWLATTGPLAGCIYLPRTAINPTEMWQQDTFDPDTIDQELGWARTAGYNALRVFLQFLAWHQDPEGFTQRLDHFLALADHHGMRVMPVLFDDRAVAARDPSPGPQGDPLLGVPDGRWTPSPGHRRVNDRAAWPELERYVKDVLGRFASDPRVLAWDLYNEPGQSGQGDRSLSLVMECFRWAREIDPAQPLTAGTFGSPAGLTGELQSRLMEFSDVLSFHSHAPPAEVGRCLVLHRLHGRPILCTDWLHRPNGNRFETILPLLAREHIGAFHRGLFAGRTQTYLPDGSRHRDLMPRTWQHDVFHPDGTPYDPAEMQILRRFRKDFHGTPPDPAESGIEPQKAEAIP